MTNKQSEIERARGRILTNQGREKLQPAIDNWASENGISKVTPNQIYKKFKDQKEYIGSDTIRKILTGSTGVDEKSIRILFDVFELTLESADHQLEDDSKPIIDDPPSDDSQTRWVGRETLITEILQKLQGNCRILSIVGITGIGKTSLAKQLAKQPQLSQKLPKKEISFSQESPTFQVVAERILGAELANSPELQQNTDHLVNAMVDRLKSQPILLILDMIEVILEPDGKSGHRFKDSLFATFLDRVVLADTMPSRIVLTSQDRPPIMAQGRYPDDRFFEKPLRGLEEEEAIALFRQWDVTVEGEKTQEYLKRIFAVYEGHPLALSAIAGEVRESPYEGSIESYWGDYGYEIEQAEQLKAKTDGDPSQDKPDIDRFSPKLKDLVLIRIENTINRLQMADRIAHELLCSGAIYRRPEELGAWLTLMSEFDREKKALAFQTLRRRFFLEEEKTPNHQLLYRLHPLMRRVALEHLDKLDIEVQE
ncbi:ATP-binding protein [Kamptonema sp. UHCC 0994]|uniref:NB-ARC domain-containing protein n=1 Tax=Kamptonema sp. UHCC 0994 TaxID=3031329 RepID=UPI0023B8E83B|nr:ATP-binding protein [Kamptonema sp. UHCC 0994]MDF0551524.1 ATP-binding protein [Kamptonema sp. UHCC 0994]